MLLLFNFCFFLFIGPNGYFPLFVYAHIVILTHFLLRLFRCCFVVVVVVVVVVFFFFFF